jgi:hypothetical protein
LEYQQPKFETKKYIVVQQKCIHLTIKGSFRIQWHRFEDDSPLHPLLKTLPHIAFKVNNLNTAIEGKEILLGPYEPIDGYFVAVINDAGVPIEFVQTELTDEELWERARNKEGSLYRT